ncbi:MAG: cytochrome C oxidase subunit IV [Acidimicrobiia bacterium]|nr:cytochrome C oxidase subunit IV [Acidimicrobiia bacterium]
MSVTESTAQPAHTPAGTSGGHLTDDHAEHPAHPSDWTYVKVALVLGVLTGIEVFTYFRSVLDWGRLLMPALLVLMAVKFYLIAAYFMHLKFDSKVLRRMFGMGLALALSVYIIALLAFQFFGDWA